MNRDALFPRIVQCVECPAAFSAVVKGDDELGDGYHFTVTDKRGASTVSAIIGLKDPRLNPGGGSEGFYLGIKAGRAAMNPNSPRICGGYALQGFCGGLFIAMTGEEYVHDSIIPQNNCNSLNSWRK